MLRSVAVLLALIPTLSAAQATTTGGSPRDDAAEVLDLERRWATAIQNRDTSAMSKFLGDDYFLAIAVQGSPIAVVPRAAWLATLKDYITESFSIDDSKVQTYGDVAIVRMLFTQKASVRGQDRSGQFFITDVWVRTASGWRVMERHSSRPEPQTVARP